MNQITLNFEKGLTDAYQTCREYVGARIHRQGKPQKAIAADMDYSPSHLTRKIAQNPDDSMRFTLDDLEKFIEVTGDKSPVHYLIEKYLCNEDPDAIEKQIKELQAKLDMSRGRAA
jgi:hypothetical protein